MNRNGSKRKERTVRVWTYEQTRKAVPYIASVLRSLREQWLEAQSRDLHAQRLANQPGRPDRTALVAQGDVAQQARRAKDRYEETMTEINDLDIFCLDPIGGEAVIPFLHDQKLAWYVFDLFDEQDPLRRWRYHDDPLETRRPIADVLPEPSIPV